MSVGYTVCFKIFLLSSKTPFSGKKPPLQKGLFQKEKEFFCIQEEKYEKSRNWEYEWKFAIYVKIRISAGKRNQKLSLDLIYGNN